MLIVRALSETETSGNSLLFVAVIVGFLILSYALFLRDRQRPGNRVSGDENGEVFSAEAEHHLRALEEVHELFGGSLSSADTLRLIASRVPSIVSCRSVNVFVLDRGREKFIPLGTSDASTETLLGRSGRLTEDFLESCVTARSVQIYQATAFDHPAVVIPLKVAAELFGVMYLDLEIGADPTVLDPNLLDAVGERISPLAYSAVSYELTRANALRDAATDLPNERAFYLILENQVAEAQRKGATRPLTILALEVASFDKISLRFGHTAGQRVTSVVAQLVTEQLRQMDFLARSNGNEFLIVLPTASKEIAQQIIARIQANFSGRNLMISDTEDVELELSIGWAAFGTDGDTPDTMLKIARERKAQSKSMARGHVIWFPGEHHC